MKHFVSHRGNFSFKPLKLQFPLMETKVSRLETKVSPVETSIYIQAYIYMQACSFQTVIDE